MNIKQISTEQEYQEAFKRLQVIFDADLNTPEGDELDKLGTSIDNYEKIHYSIGSPNPVEAVKFRKEQLETR